MTPRTVYQRAAIGESLNAHSEDLATPYTPVEPTPASQPSPAQKIFYGQDGLRAGWSLLIFIALMAGLIYTVSHVGQRFYHPAHDPAGESISLQFAFIAELPLFLAVVLAAWIMSKIERRPSGTYGLGGTHKLPNFFAGLAWGASCLSVLVFSLWKSGLLVINSRLLFGSDILRYASLWLVGFLLVALLEEYLTRGYLLFTLARGFSGLYRAIFKTSHSEVLGFWTSAIILSTLFGLGHGKNPGESPIGLLAAALASLVFCLSLWRTGSLWWAIGFHTSWDWAQSFLYGVADSGLIAQHRLLVSHPIGKPLLSGGATGPEGSLFVLPTLTLITVVILLTLPRRTAGYLPEGTAHPQLPQTQA